MVCTVLILIFSIKILGAWEFLENDGFSLIDSWGLTSVGQVTKVKEKFPDKPELACGHLYMTEGAPFTAIVLYKSSGRLLCMGSIVDTRHILTAKRCYDVADVTDLLILVGYRKAYWGKNAQVLRAERVIRHGDSRVALLRLKDRIKFTEYVDAVKLPTDFTKLEVDFKKTWPPPYQIVGFFVDRFDVPGEKIEKEKLYQIKEDKFVPFDDCKKNFSKLELDKDKLFCTIGNASFCWGAYGSPVLKWVKNTFYLQIGVVFGENCTETKTGPLLAARTDVLGDWIHGNTWKGHQPS